jgi:hypothetical protein
MRWPRLRQGCGLLVGQADRNGRQRGLWNAHVLRELAHLTEDVGEHVIGWLEARRVAAVAATRPAMSNPSM